MKDFDRIYLIMRDVLRAFGFVVIVSSTNEMARTLFTPDTLARARDGQTWCHVVPTFARFQVSSSAAIPRVLRDILLRSRPLFAQAALAYLRDNPFVTGDSVVDFMDGLAEAIMRGCKEWRFLTSDGFRSGQVCLFLSSSYFDDQKSLLIHDHFANLTETTPFKLQFAHECTLVKEGEDTPWVSHSVFPPVEDDVLLYLCLMGGKSSRSLVTKNGKTLTFEEIMDLMDKDPDNSAIYNREPRVDPIPFREALTEAENMKHSIVHFQNLDHTTNDLMRFEALVLGSIVSASHANGFAGIAIDAFLSALLYELGMSESPLGKIIVPRSSPWIIVPFLAPPEKSNGRVSCQAS